MKRSTDTGISPRAARLALCVLAAAALYGQDESSQTPEKPRHLSFGFRVRHLPLNSYGVMANRSTMTTDPATATTPARDWSFTTASHSGSFGGGVGLEYASFGRWTITAEAIFNPLKYTKVTGVASGTDDPTTGHDDRTRTYINEDTRARLWDFPVLFHYRGIRATGPLSKLYLAGGAAIRTVTSIRSSTKTTFPDGTTDENTLVVRPARRSVLGAVAGIGIRIVDDFNINWTPEIRYTRWAASTYELQSTMSPKNQIELSLGFTF